MNDNKALSNFDLSILGSSDSMGLRRFDKPKESQCVRCLRNSPLGSLLGLIFVLSGGGLFGGGIVFGRRSIIDTLEEQSLFPYVDYGTYVVVGSLVLFSLLAYLICSLTTGWNGRHYFEGTRCTQCGKCLIGFFLIIFVIVIIVWLFVACCVSYIVLSMAAFKLRENLKAKTNTTIIYDLSYFGLTSCANTTCSISSTDYNTHYLELLICSLIALGGAFLVIFGYLIMAIGIAMNYAGLGEIKIYNVHENQLQNGETQM